MCCSALSTCAVIHCQQVSSVAVCCSVLLVFCSVLQCAAVCGGVLQCVAVYCIVLQCVAMCCSVQQCVAVCCSVSHHFAIFCSALQCVALCCIVLQCVADTYQSAKKSLKPSNPASGTDQMPRDPTPLLSKCIAVCCSVLQCVAVCCSVLQCVALLLSKEQCVKRKRKIVSKEP